tara:strand:+ start:1440 stop:1889 length:450 start_codon:yes stop_codon:yes gene_type:complete
VLYLNYLRNFKLYKHKKINLYFYILAFFFYLFEANADWTKVTESNNGQVFYVNMLSISEEKGRVFFWELIDYKKEDEYGDLSAKIYVEGDCENLRFKWLKLSYHKDPMGKDQSQNQAPSKIVSYWQHPRLNSTSMKVLSFVCENKGITL